jgi:hypothetical protein
MAAGAKISALRDAAVCANGNLLKIVNPNVLAEPRVVAHL